MNINNIRKNYDNLSMLQRLALADQAQGRDDESEALAIKNASPKFTFSQPDFVGLMNEIITLRLCNLITRLGCIIEFDLLSQWAMDKPQSQRRNTKRIENDMKLVAYRYVRATEAMTAVYKEFGLRTNVERELVATLFSAEVFDAKDRTLRLYAFSESEAINFFKTTKGTAAEFATVESEIAGIRDWLLEKAH